VFPGGLIDPIDSRINQTNDRTNKSSIQTNQGSIHMNSHINDTSNRTNRHTNDHSINSKNLFNDLSVDINNNAYPSNHMETESKICALRETFEETGIFPFGNNRLNPVMSLNHNDLNKLKYFARWITPEQLPKRYDTRFYLAVHENELLGVNISQHEVEKIDIVDPLCAIHSDFRLFPPQFYLLSELSVYKRWQDIQTPRQIETITPKTDDKRGVMLYYGDNDGKVLHRCFVDKSGGSLNSVRLIRRNVDGLIDLDIERKSIKSFL